MTTPVTGRPWSIQLKGLSTILSFIFDTLICYEVLDVRIILCSSFFLNSGWSRVLYSTEVKLFPWIPEFVITFLTKTALIEVYEARELNLLLRLRLPIAIPFLADSIILEDD